MARIKTTWLLRTYDVWGNAKDGYEVNDAYSGGEIELNIPVTVNNVGTPQEFKSAYPTDRQIRQAFGVNCRLDLDGDDLHITVNRKRDGYPIGEMLCESHDSLSPIRRKGTYAVIVGNIGKVYSGPSKDMAIKTYYEYVEQSKSTVGRAAGEPVTMMMDGEILGGYDYLPEGKEVDDV